VPLGDVINLATKSLHLSLSNYLHYSYPNNMAKRMTKGLQNSTHVSKPKWADPKLVVVMKTKDKTLFVLAPSICCHHISPTLKCSYIWKKIQNEIFLCIHSNKLQMKIQPILQFAFQKWHGTKTPLTFNQAKNMSHGYLCQLQVFWKCMLQKLRSVNDLPQLGKGIKNQGD
jgi:hypothetical protein